MRLSETEMISLWRTRLGMPADTTAPSQIRSDDALIDAQVKKDIDAWYDALLDHGPVSSLIATDITGSLTFTERSPGCLVAALPAGVRRLLAVKPDGCATARLASADDALTAARMANPFTRAGRLQPVAVSDGMELRVYAGEGAAIESVTAVVDPPVGYYEFNPKALSTAFNPLTKKFDTI